MKAKNLAQKNSNRKSNIRGVGLMELMVAMGVMGVVMFGAATLNSRISSTAIDTRAKNNEVWLIQNVRSTLNYGDSCMLALGPAGGNITMVDPVPVSQEVTLSIPNLGAGAAMNMNTLMAGQVLPAVDLQVNSLTMQNPFKTGNGAVPAGQTEFMAEFWMTAQKLNASNGGQSLRSHLISTVTVVRDDATGALVNCGNTSQSASQQCEAIKCVWNAGNPVGQQCVCPTYPMGCPPYTYPLAIVNGNFICSDLGAAGAQCPIDSAGNQTYLVGVGLNPNPASPACVPLPNGQKECFGVNYCAEGLTGDAGVAPPPSMNCVVPIGTQWTVNSYTCASDTAVTITNGNTGVLTDSSGINQGQATFSCSNNVATVAPAPPATCAPPAAPPACVNAFPFTATGTGPTSVDIKFSFGNQVVGAPLPCKSCDAVITDTTTGLGAAVGTFQPSASCVANGGENGNNYLNFNVVSGHTYDISFRNQYLNVSGSITQSNCTLGTCGTVPASDSTAPDTCLLTHWIGTCSGMGLDENDVDLTVGGPAGHCTAGPCTRCTCTDSSGVKCVNAAGTYTCVADPNNSNPPLLDCGIKGSGNGVCNSGFTWWVDSTFPDANTCIAYLAPKFVPITEDWACCMHAGAVNALHGYTLGPNGQCP